MITMMQRTPYSRLRVLVSASVAALGFLLILGYVSIGHRAVKFIYDNDFLSSRMMSGKSTTPLRAYADSMDDKVLKLAVVLVVLAIALLLSRNLLGVALLLISILVTSVGAFLLLDIFPPLASALHFNLIPYYQYRLENVGDPELVFRGKPLTHSESPNFRGWAYSPSYGIEERGETVTIDTDEAGFRNKSGLRSADVVILGSSFPWYGSNLDDTYAKRLERHLGGMTTLNLGLGGYGPFEFVKVFQRYGLPKKPQFAIFTFHTGDVDTYLRQYITGEEHPRVTNLKTVFFGSFWSRWRLAAGQVSQIAGNAFWTPLQTGLKRAMSTSSIHPDVAVLRLPGNRTERIVFLTRHTGRSTEESLNSPTWQLFEKILIDFRDLCERNQVIPILAYIPWSTEVYAEYSTLDSGANWLEARESMIATGEMDEKAARAVASRAGIGLVSFLPPFKDAARQGKLVYRRLDDHWNSEGAEIAAEVTAQALRHPLQNVDPFLSTAGFSLKEPVHALIDDPSGTR